MNYQESLIKRKSVMIRQQISACLIYELLSMEPDHRQCWVEDIFLEREEKSEFNLAKKLFTKNNPEKIKQYLRMYSEQFEYILKIITPRIQKEDTHFRKAITPAERLILTIRYLATGASQRHLSYSFRVGHSTVCQIIKEVCKALWECLGPEVLQPPTKERWIKIAEEFNYILNFPNCLGAIDGKHIRLKAPSKSGSEFYNYKGYFFIVLLAICDAKYRFTMVDIGDSGRHSDGGVFSNSEIGKKFENGKMNLPEQCFLPNSNSPAPYVLLGDDAFPLKPYIMKPYPGKFLPDHQNIFNYRLSRARRCIENAFGILAVRWQIYYGMMNCDVELAEQIVQATVVLHNYLQSSDPDDENCVDENAPLSNWRRVPNSMNLNGFSQLVSHHSNHSSRCARFIRDTYCRYFNTTGAVAWQWSINQ